ncbi:B12-binding domain-containing radical SAM protein [Methylocystis sp.]|uniref:B12-binding domain-containing radical SAM protein n=1 Tax=Methylocystis sp. TaxID=1911079 RepID=UPI003DA56740
MSAIPQRESGRPQRALLVGFQDQDNLGLRYLSSAARSAGHETEIATYEADASALVRQVLAGGYDFIGLSLIFQYMTPSFASAVTALREAGVRAHISMGGHYPSFAYEEVMRGAPGLDSIVRFDGELTLASLLNSLSHGAEWRTSAGIAFRGSDGDIHANCLREPLGDLDALPWPDRDTIDYENHSLSTASVLGSRGCPWDCSFCSIRPFYEAQGGQLRRLRKPDAVVDEMIDLHERRSVPVFLFQDDDFLATGRRAREWAGGIADRLVDEGYAGDIAFKISCRSDEIDEAAIRRLMAGGLTHIYMGVESGDETSLATMNKKLGPQRHVRAGEILKSLGLSFDFGFMLMEPYSTFETIRNNIAFLDAFVGDGWSVAPFCRMLPYAGTPIRERLVKEGRLTGSEFQPDYRFLDPKLDIYYEWMIETFHRRNFTAEGLCHLLRYYLFEARLRLRGKGVAPQRLAQLQYIAAVANGVACQVLRSALDHIERTPLETLRRDREFLKALTAHEAREEEQLMQDLRRYCTLVAAERRESVSDSFDKSWTFEGVERDALRNSDHVSAA